MRRHACAGARLVLVPGDGPEATIASSGTVAGVHLRSVDFLDAGRYPQLRFVSQALRLVVGNGPEGDWPRFHNCIFQA